MKKFKSLMLAALASAALAAPSFGEGHDAAPNFGITGVSGEVVVKMSQSSNTPDTDGAKTTTIQQTGIGDVNLSLNSDYYAVEFKKDDEGDGNVNFSMNWSHTSGDNTISASAKLLDITDGDGITYDAASVTGGNKTATIKIGKFGSSEYYKGGMEHFTATVDNDKTAATDPALNKGSEFTDEHLVIAGFRGLQANISAGDIGFEVAIPWMNVTEGDYALSAKASTTAQMCAPGGVTPTYSASATGAVTGETLVCTNGTVDAVDPVTGKAATPGYAKVATNVTGLRPVLTVNAGSVSVSALAYSLNFNSTNGAETQTKTDSGAQLMAGITTGNAVINLGYTTRTHEDLGVKVTPSVLNGNVAVTLGGGSKVGASFEQINNGASTKAAEVTATRFSASYLMPFFVENLNLKLGVGTATQTADAKASGGSANAIGAEWNYAF